MWSNEMKHKNELRITEAEWEVMESVWKADDQTAGEIVGRVEQIRNRSHRTVRTLLARLVEKGAVTVRIDGSRHLYTAAITREESLHSAARSFSERFFGGDLQTLLLHFVENESLSDSDMQELKHRLESMQKDKPTAKLKRTKKPSKRGRKRS